MNHLTTEVMEVTPNQAGKWIESNLYYRQRPLRKNHVVFLADQMRKGQFIEGTQLYFARTGNQSHLVDGQHRLTALTQANVSLRFIITTNHVKTEKEMGWLYTAFDRQLTRSPSDAIRAVQPVGVEGFSSWQINAFVGALKILCKGFVQGYPAKVGMPEVLFGLNDWAVFARKYFDTIKNADGDIGKKLRRKACLAMGMATFRFADNAIPNVSYDFWGQVAEDNGLYTDDPRKQLNKRLLTLDTPEGRGSGKVYVNDASIIALCTIAWNLYANGEKSTRLVVSRGRQYPILYTPFDYSKASTEYRDMYDNSYKDYVPQVKDDV